MQFQSGGQLGRVLERDHAVEVVVEVFAQFGDPVAQHVQLHLYSLRFGQKAPIPRFSHDTYALALEKLQYRGDELPDSPISESSTFHRPSITRSFYARGYSGTQEAVLRGLHTYPQGPQGQWEQALRL